MKSYGKCRMKGDRVMKHVKSIVGLVFLVAMVTSGSVWGQLHVDPDTGISIQDGFDINVYAVLPEGTGVHGLAFAPGGSFGTDLYAVTRDSRLYRIDSAGQVEEFAHTPTRMYGIAFPNPGSDFGDYVYLGSGDGYYGGNMNIYRMDVDGNAEIFFPGSMFTGGTMNKVRFSPPGKSLWQLSVHR